MTAIFKKHRAVLPVILVIIVMSYSLTVKASSDAEKKVGLPAGTIGHQQDEGSEKASPPHLGTRSLSKLGHNQAEDAVASQSGQPVKENKVIDDQQRDIKEHN